MKIIGNDTIIMRHFEFKRARGGGIPVIAFLISGLLLFVCSGCLSKRNIKQHPFAFQSPAPAKTASQTGDVVAINSVVVSPLFSSHSFVYRTGPESYEVDPYSGFLIAPDQTLAIAVRAHFLGSGQFRDVTEPGSRVKADKYIEIYVSDLYGDFSQQDHAVSVLSMRISCFESGAGRKLVLQKDYSRRLPLREKTAAAVMSGWNTALGEILAEFVVDLTHARSSG